MAAGVSGFFYGVNKIAVMGLSLVLSAPLPIAAQEAPAQTTAEPATG